ncbi:MAG TPA: hypothetical protein PL045_10230, partial [Chitinophagaceae bacterium]|nr:hypothetical protein [Chitinophagaceae bacterium]
MRKIFLHTLKTITAFYLLLTSLHVSAQKVFDFSSTCKNAYQQITALKLAPGALLVNQARRENPNNLIPEILDNYIDFYTLFFNENPEDYKALLPKFETRLDKIEDGSEKSPYYNFCRTVIYMQKACVEIKFGRQWAAGWDFKKSFALIKQNKKSFPSFLPNDMVDGPMLVAASTVPDGYKWLAGLFGIKGSLNDGVKEIQKLVNSNDELAKLFFNEASFYYCYVLFYIQNKPEEAFNFIKQRNLDLVNNHLLAYMAANLAINNKQSDYAKNVILNRKISNEYLATPIWDLEMGYIKLHHLEMQEAASYFQNFISKFKGNYYVKDACEKLSWCWYLQNNMAAANNARQQVIMKGGTLTDADKQS